MSFPVLFLDGAQGLIILPLFFILHVVATMFIEGYVLHKFGYNPFRKSIYHAFIINLISLVVGLMFYVPFTDWARELAGDNIPRAYFVIGFYFIQTLIVEGITLRLMNKQFPTKKLLLANLLMNVLTYALLVFIIFFLEG